MSDLILRSWDGKKFSIGKPEYFDDSVNFRFHHFDIDCEKPILERFTGLHDSTKWEELTDVERDEWIKAGHTKEEWKGRRIFEGDIVRRTITEGWITEPVTGLIVFKNGCFTLEYEGLSKDYIHNDLIIDSKMVEYDAHSKLKEEQYSYEVIGNIHNNPELLS